MRLNPWAARLRRDAHAPSIALEPGKADRPATSAPARPPRAMLSHDDLLWFTSVEDDEGRVTVALLECPRNHIGVLVDENGKSTGLQLSRTDAQDLHRSLVTWLANTGRTVAS